MLYKKRVSCNVVKHPEWAANCFFVFPNFFFSRNKQEKSCFLWHYYRGFGLYCRCYKVSSSFSAAASLLSGNHIGSRSRYYWQNWETNFILTVGHPPSEWLWSFLHSLCKRSRLRRGSRLSITVRDRPGRQSVNDCPQISKKTSGREEEKKSWCTVHNLGVLSF